MNLRHVLALRRQFGSSWLARRGLYALKLRSGVLRRRLPHRSWDDIELSRLLQPGSPAEAQAFFERRVSSSPRFFFSPGDREVYAPLLRQFDAGSENPVRHAEKIASGRFRFFAHQDVDCRFPPDWHVNTATAARTPVDIHWSDIRDFGHGDIKLIWELSRFSSAYTLVRAYWRTGDERYPELFWQLVESWRDANPAQYGANWKCGQEASFRTMAWCFGLYGFLHANATTPERVRNLAQVLATTAERIEANIDYAISQANNHGISEGVGLWTIGSLFPEFARAEQWQRVGRQVLESEGQKLIYDDGAFSQHSVNYHRVMLHDCLWVLQLAELHERPFSARLKERVRQAGEFLYSIQDETTGGVPYYGQNDGALVLPLNNCGYRDFRPAVGATAYFATTTRLFRDGAWDEDLLWLFGTAALEAPVESKPREDIAASEGGYYTLRSPEGFIFTRCGSFRHRPGQADMLHADLWWRGQNIARDAGTYSYNSAEPWADAFSGTALHNTVTVDGMDQMERVGRFLWLPWVEGRVRSLERVGELGYFEGEHNGFNALRVPVAYRRGIVQLGSGRWLVLDAAESRSEHTYRLHWLMGDFPHQVSEQSGAVSLTTPAGPYHVLVGSVQEPNTISLVRADPGSARGWCAPFYGHREPALSLAVEQRACSTIFWTLFSPDIELVHVNNGSIRIQAPSGLSVIELGGDVTGRLVRRISTPGAELQVRLCTRC